ncbi:MAG: alginate export family protein [Planctomycetes bacterium]|nr:alginate export family protein [Planctomycetota bacterium]
MRARAGWLTALVGASAAAARAQQSAAWEWSYEVDARLRAESYANDPWSGGAQDHDYVWWRATPSVDLRRKGVFRALAQVLVAFENGDEAGLAPVDEDRGDWLQAFVEAPIAANASVWAGRRVLAFGSERLISARRGPNVPRAFDGGGLALTSERATFELFGAHPVAPAPGEFDDEANERQSLRAAYGTWKFGDELGLDVYTIDFEDETAEYEQGAGLERRRTFGARSFGREAGWDWNIEAFLQRGRFAGGDIRAWSVATEIGRSFELGGRDAHLGLRANVISGDDDPTDDVLGTFQAMFPRGKYFGEMGLIGPANLVNLHPSFELRLSERWSLFLAGVLYWRQSESDGAYGLAGELLEPGAGSDSRYIGTQLDLGFEFAATSCLSVAFGVSALLPGGFMEDRGRDDAVLFAGGELALTFPTTH